MNKYTLSDWSGGIRYELINQSPRSTSFLESENIQIYPTSEGYGFQKVLGNINILTSALPANTEIVGLHEYIKTDNRYLVVATKDNTKGEFYLFSNGSLTLKKTGLSPAKKYTFANFNNGVIVCNGLDDPFFFEIGASPEITQLNSVDIDGFHVKGLPMVVHEPSSRVFIATGSRLNACKLGDPFDWSTIDEAFNVADFKNASSKIKALRMFGSNLLVYRENDIVPITGNNPANFAIDYGSVISNTGTVSPYSVENFEAFQLFYSKLGLFPFEINLNNKLKLSTSLSRNIQRDLNNLDKTRLDDLIIISLTETGLNELWIHVPYVNKPNNSVWWVYNFITGAFTKRVQQKINCACIFDGKLYTGTPDGKILNENNGKTFDGAVIPFFVETPDFDFGDSIRKEVEQLRVSLDNSRNNKHYLRFIYNGDETNYTEEFIEENLSDDWIMGEGVLGEVFLTLETPLNTMLPRPSPCESIRIKIYGDEIGHDCSYRKLEFREIEEA